MRLKITKHTNKRKTYYTIDRVRWFKPNVTLTFFVYAITDLPLTLTKAKGIISRRVIYVSECEELIPSQFKSHEEAEKVLNDIKAKSKKYIKV